MTKPLQPRRRLRGRKLIAATVLLAQAAVAQEAPPPRLVLDLGLDLDHSTNSALDPAGGSSNTAAGLRFGLTQSHVTRDQSFALRLGGVLKAQETGETGFVDPGVTLTYGRDGKASRFDLRLDHTTSAVDESSSAALAATGGTLTVSSADIGLELGKGEPLGFFFSAQSRANDYSQSDGVSVYDSTSTGFSLGGHLRSGAPGQDIGLTYDQRQTTNEDLAASETRSRGIRLSYERDVGAAMLGLSVGAIDAETVKLGAVTAQSQGETASVDLSRAMGLGKVGLRLALDRDAGGARQSLVLRHEVEGPIFAVQSEFGAAARPGDGAEAIGKLALSATLPRDELRLALSRDLALDDTGADSLRDTAEASWSHKLDPRTGLRLAWSLGSEGDAGSANLIDDVTRQSVTASLNRDLAADWQVEGGVRLTSIDRATSGQAEDQKVFLSIGRKFILIP